MAHVNMLITGAGGFLGRCFVEGGEARGMGIRTLGRDSRNTVMCDLSRVVPTLDDEFDTIVHCAALAHLASTTPADEALMRETNVGGTRRLLDALTASPPKRFVLIGSVAVYGADEGEMIGEQHPLVPVTTYGETKLESESLVTEWGKVHGVSVTVLRLPLVVGLRPPGNLGALVKAVEARRFFLVGGGHARRSMVLAEDVVNFVLDAVADSGTFNLTDGQHPSYRELTDVCASVLDVPRPRALPAPFMAMAARVGDAIRVVSGRGPPYSSTLHRKLMCTLTYDDAYARSKGWTSRPVLEHSQVWLSSS